MLNNATFWFCDVLWWAGLLFLLPGWRTKSGNPAFRFLLVAFALKGVALMLADSRVLAGLDRRTGVPNIAILLQHLTGGLLFTAAILAVLAYWANPPEQARRIVARQFAICGAAVTVLVAFWLATSTDLSGHLSNYLVENAERPPGVAYLLVYTAMFGFGLLETTRLCWRCAGMTQIPRLRTGLRLAAAGSAVYTLHPVNRMLSAVLEPLGMNPLTWEGVSLIAIGTGTSLFVLGVTWPAWVQRLSRLSAWISDHRAYRRIRPLWSALYEVMPEIALEPPRHPLINIRYHLYRTVIEIRDGWLAIGRGMDPDEARRAAEQGRAAGHDGLALEAFTEAEQLKAALVALRAGHEPKLLPVPAQRTHHSENFSSELAWLIKIAQEFTRHD